MSIISGQKPTSFEQSVIPESYNSKTCSLFTQSLSKIAQPQILDLGPVCQENIMFFGSRVERLFVNDLFYRLHRCRAEKQPIKTIWDTLDYPKECFDGILLWDLIDRLAKGEVDDFIKLCSRMLKPRGIIMLTAFNRQTFLPDVHTFVVKDNFSISFRSQQHLKLFVTHRHNREIMALFSSFSPVKAQLNKNGFREFLFQRSVG